MVLEGFTAHSHMLVDDRDVRSVSSIDAIFLHRHNGVFFAIRHASKHCSDGYNDRCSITQNNCEIK